MSDRIQGYTMIIFVGQIILVSEHFVGNLFFPFLSIFTNIVNIRIDMPRGRKKREIKGTSAIMVTVIGFCSFLQSTFQQCLETVTCKTKKKMHVVNAKGRRVYVPQHPLICKEEAKIFQLVSEHCRQMPSSTQDRFL